MNNKAKIIGLNFIAFALFGALVGGISPVGYDWLHTFTHANFLHPYSVATFTNPPWAVAFLPHSTLPVPLGAVLNTALNVGAVGALLATLEADLSAYALTLTSPPFFDLLIKNNIDWVPALGLVLGLVGVPWAGALMLAVKPHGLGLAVVSWLRSPRALWPAGAVGMASFALWGFWPPQIQTQLVETPWNMAPWPLFVPLGLWLVWLAHKNEQLDAPTLGAVTPLFMPYVAAYSLTFNLAIVAARWRSVAVALWCFSWYLVVFNVA